MRHSALGGSPVEGSVVSAALARHERHPLGSWGFPKTAVASEGNPPRSRLNGGTPHGASLCSTDPPQRTGSCQRSTLNTLIEQSKNSSASGQCTIFMWNSLLHIRQSTV
ncbi:hypothetical protein I8752_35135 [Nostocaceae cyanobacterium CENA369]|uniref:Uncharacterized protein n=1 Tax=Dendronalium phyllosphericum CENA369 TaxID=1725256 RepID=A0A8J7LKY3_9NOST|nr:hypothetical protein [Dendronalium phyllosphericum]MBH8578089.1 hypothetical protein [Dendronalium phyllosphericum CENA369]